MTTSPACHQKTTTDNLPWFLATQLICFHEHETLLASFQGGLRLVCR